VKPGDLVKMKPGRGYPWRRNDVYIYIEPNPRMEDWLRLLGSDGNLIEVEDYLIEIIQ
jgi:hypothetical protein